MFKLMVVSGPTRGATYSVNRDGETSIGRQSGNNVILQSSRVSKRHCTLVASNGELIVKDQGSSNGTFVNGVLAKEKRIKSGDRISVGEFVFEVVEQKVPQHQLPGYPLQLDRQPGIGGNVVPFPGSQLPVSGAIAVPGANIQELATAPQAPKTLKEKAAWAFDNYVMPFFYGLGMKNEWRMIGLFTFAAFCLANMFVSISPLMDSSHRLVVRESARRATYIARQMADTATPLIVAHAESRVDISSAENAEGVKLAAITDMDSRIIAPINKQNGYLTSGPEALYAVKVRELFRRGREMGVFAAIGDDTVVSIEPLKAYNQTTGKNEVVGMAIVSIDTSLATMGLGDVGLVYSETMVLTAILGALALLILYRMTLKPLQILNEDFDKALKGDLNQVTHEFKWEELNPLWDLINSAIQRIPRSSGATGAGKVEMTLAAEDFAAPVSSFASLGNMGVVVCDGDHKVISINSTFEEISGIRADAAIGQPITDVARDQGFESLVMDLFSRAQPGSEGVGEDYDFSGISHRVTALAFGTMGSVKCYVLITSRNGGSRE